MLQPEMDEGMRGPWSATKARDRGWGGVTLVAEATGPSRTTITAGLRELSLPAKQRLEAAKRVRRPGAGRARVRGLAEELTQQRTVRVHQCRGKKILRRILRKIARGETLDLGDTTTLADPSVVESLVVKR